MTTNIFISDRIIDGNRKTVIVDDTGKIVNKNPSKEEMKGLKIEHYFRKSPLNRMPPDAKCYRCGTYAIAWERDSKGIETGNFICNTCYQIWHRYGTYEKPEPVQIHTKEQIIEIIKHICKEKGRTLTADDLRNSHMGLGIVLKYFGSLNNAIREAGLQTNRFNLTDEELLEFLIKFYTENGRAPITADFKNNYKYPNYQVYIKRFGSWQKALKLVGLDIDSIVRKGIIENSRQKARLSEIFVLEHFIDEGVIDLSGENCNSHIDGICPKEQRYDVKSSGLSFNGRCWSFFLDKGEDVDFYYLLAFNEDYTELMYVLRIPWNFTDKISINIGIDSSYEYNLENIKKFDITRKFKDQCDNIWIKNLIKW